MANPLDPRFILDKPLNVESQNVSDMLNPSAPTFSTETANPDVRYPETLGTPPFDKWIFFDVRSGRHVVRDQILPEKGANAEHSVGSVGLYLSETALKNSIDVNYEQTNFDNPFVGALTELLAQTGQNFFDMRVQSAGDAGGGLKQLFESVKNKVSQIASTATAGNITETIMEWLKADISAHQKNISSVVSGQKINPRTDLLYDAQQYRMNQFDFLLIPRSLSEAKAIDHIVSFFQFYMLPSYRQTELQDKVGFGAFMIGFPYEFEISIRDEQGREMEHVSKIGRSVLRHVSVDHAGAGKTAFVKSNGEYYPVATRLTLQFQEVRLLGRDSVEIRRAGVPSFDDPRV